MPGIFICYRRDDSAGFAGRLYDRLERRFGDDHIFMDASIKPGDDFVKLIEERLSSCDVLIALMGKKWLTARKGRRRRLDDPLDFVRLEIETALKSSVRVIPALLEGVGMPSPENLPDSLSAIPRLQAVQISHERFGEDANRLIAALEEVVESPKGGKATSTEPVAEPADRAPATETAEPAIIEPGTVRTNRKDGLAYVWIPPGTFQMGAVPGDDNSHDEEKPQHPVTISKGFWLAQSPVTVAAYKRFAEETRAEMPEAPRFNPDWQKEDHPIVTVPWDEAVAYSRWAGGRLPSEAEWEYAARGGKSGLVYPWGNAIDKKNANHGGSGTSPVGSYPANGFGLYDMAGNVWEWVADWYEKDYYKNSPAADPKGPISGTWRVLRGGSWYGVPLSLRASSRDRVQPGPWNDGLGFRCVREVISP